MFADDAVSFFVGIGYVTGQKFLIYAFRPQTERNKIRIGILSFELRKIDGARVDARGCSGFHAAHFKAVGLQCLGKFDARRFTRTAGCNPSVADVDQSVEKCSGGDHNTAGKDFLVQ